LLVGLQVVSQVDEHAGEWRPVPVDPPVGDVLDGDGVEVVVLGAPDFAGGDEAGLLTDPEVLGHPEPRQVREHVAQLGQRASVALSQSVQQRAAAGVRESPKDRIHARNLR
jgi:hypothetical protein